MNNRIQIAEWATVLVAGISFSLVAGPWFPLAVVLCVAVLANIWIPWRYQTSQPNKLLLQGILEFPFLGLLGYAWWTSSDGLELSFASTSVAGSYLFLRAVLEIYREPTQANKRLLIFMTFALIVIGGISQKNPAYLGCLAIYLSSLLYALSSDNSQSDEASKTTQPKHPTMLVIALFCLALVMAHFSVGYLPLLKGIWESDADVSSGPGEGRTQSFGVGSDLWSMDGLPESREMVARVYGPATHLRGAVRAYYRNGRWRRNINNLKEFEEIPGSGDFQLPGGQPQDSQHWEIEPLRPIKGPLPSPNGTHRLLAQIDKLKFGAYDQIEAKPKGSYQVFATANPSQGEGRSLKRHRPKAWKWAFYLDCPVDLEGTLDIAADKIIGEQKDPAQIAQTVADYLAKNGTFALSSEGRDATVMETFLKREMTGGSELFATSMALILRRRGVHTRYVTGYRLLERNMWGGYYVVRERDAHAWVEVLLENGWTSFDPSPKNSIQLTHPEGLEDWSGEAFLASMRARSEHLLRWLVNRDWVKTFQLLLALSLLSLPYIFLKRRRKLRRAGMCGRTLEEAKLQKLFRRAVKGIAPLGVIYQSWETPLELAQKFSEHPHLAEWFSSYSRARFRGFEQEDVRDLETSLEKALESLRE